MDHGDTERLRRRTLVVLALGTSFVLLWMISDFLMALVLAIVLSTMFHPLYRWFGKRARARREVAAGLTIFVVLLGVILPVFGFLAIVADQALRFARVARPWVEQNLTRKTAIDDWIERVPALEVLRPYRDEIPAKLGEFAASLGSWAIAVVTAAARETATLALLLFVALYAMYFFLLHGRDVLRQLFFYLPLAADDERRMVERFTSVARATIRGTIVIGLIQGALGGLAFWVAGIDGAALWGTVMALLSVVPGVGSALVWIPVVVSLGIEGRWVACIGLATWCAGVVGSVDNFLRPWLVGKDTKLPDLLILLSTLGGLSFFGAIGFIVGPILAALCLTVWDLYGTAFGDILPPAPEMPPSVRLSRWSFAPEPPSTERSEERKE
jgi:predicted PurR-regulated permease PerM